ncbi:protein kinase [Chloroflexota bacterium]
MRDSMIETRLGNYRIEQALGRGGMARVYLGHDLALNRPVAIKVIEPELRETGSYAIRFQQEAQSIAALEHQHIVPVHYFGKQDNLYYLVMKFIEGEDLAALLDRYAGRGEYLPAADMLNIIEAVGSALDYAHSRGVIHRDVKPSNVMIDVDGRPYLTDFGLALDVSRGTVGEVFGTPHYVSPEQAKNSADAVPQSDLYSLGVMMFEMFTGVVPFDDPTPTAIALQHIMNEPPAPRALNPDLALSIENVILKALAKSPAERYQTGADITAALRQALQAVNTTAETAPALPPLPPGFTPPAVRRPSTQPVADEVRASLATRPVEPLQPSIAHRVQKKAPAAEQPSQPTRAATPPPAERPRNKLILIAAGLLAVAVVVVALIAAGAIFSQPGESSTTIPEAVQLPTATALILPTTVVPSPTPVPIATEQPAQVAVVASPTPVPIATAQPAPTIVVPSPTPILIETEQPAQVAVVASPTPVPTKTTQPLPSPTAIPAPTEIVPVGPTAAPGDWLPVSFVYNADAFYWINNAGRNISSEHIAFARIDGMQHFEGNRWSYWTMETGRCMELVFADVSAPPRPAGCQPNAWFTPTRTQDTNFWTDSGQFRVLWQGQEIAICEIAAGLCYAFVPPA